jgi:pimeloyl-ACP methyl ester carboxylesterase/ketosteroid isomerase-like protein
VTSAVDAAPGKATASKATTSGEDIAPGERSMPAVKKGMASVNGTHLYYETAGAGDAVILLEGGQLDRRMWDEQFALLAREFRTIRFDVRGFGASDARRGPYQSHEDLASLLDFLGIPRAHLVGLSLGGRIAIDLALTHPEKVESLVLAGPGLSGFPWSEERPRWSRRIREAAAAHDGKAAARAWLESDYMKPAASNPKCARRVRELALANSATWIQPDEEEELKPPAYDRLPEIRVPTLVVVGSRDIPDIHRIAARLEEKIPGARRITIERAGHMVNLEQPERFNTVALEFLRRQHETPGVASKSADPSGDSAIAGAERRKVMAAVKALRHAGLTRDVEALERLYAPDYFHTNPDGSLMTREQVLASYRAPPTLALHSVEAEEPKVVLRGDFAVVSERLALRGKTSEGHPFVSHYRVTYLLERWESAWRFLNSHASLLGAGPHPSTR